MSSQQATILTSDFADVNFTANGCRLVAETVLLSLSLAMEAAAWRSSV